MTSFTEKYAGKTKRDRERRRELKARAVVLMGGCCTDCGYDRALCALQFHHIGFDKTLNISATMSWEGIVNELHLCELLCANCHAIRHEALREAGMERVGPKRIYVVSDHPRVGIVPAKKKK